MCSMTPGSIVVIATLALCTFPLLVHSSIYNGCSKPIDAQQTLEISTLRAVSSQLFGWYCLSEQVLQKVAKGLLAIAILYAVSSSDRLHMCFVILASIA